MFDDGGSDEAGSVAAVAPSPSDPRGRKPLVLDTPYLVGVELGRGARESLGAEFALTRLPDAAQHETLERLTGLTDRDGGSLTDGEVLEVMAAWARQAAAAESQVRAWAQVLAARPAMSPTWRLPSGRRSETAADEIGLRLGISRRRGQQLIDEGRALYGNLWPVHEELAQGRIDERKASILVEGLAEQEPHVALAVCEQVLPVAPELDHVALRRRVQQEVVRTDPTEAEVRHERAVLRRRVHRVRVLPDGMAAFSAVLAAPDAVALEQACEAAARAARASGDGRTLDQLRADALASMGARALTDQSLPLLRLAEAGTPPAPRAGRVTRSPLARSEAPVPVPFSGRTACLTVVATAAVQRGEPVPPSLAQVADHDIYDWEPDPWDLPGTTATDTPQDLDPGNDPYVDWNPAPTFRPGVDAPELVGYGALSPGAVRSLHGSAPWIRVEEPVVPDAGAPPPVDSYRPSAALDRFVRRRDVTCVVPGCLVPASRCDVDHLVPWPLGATAADNLHALCRRHHLLKTHAGHTLTVLPDGTVRWRTALGQVLDRSPDGVLTRGAERPRDRSAWGRHRARPRPTDAEIDRLARDHDESVEISQT